jgi:hypothetical protein
MRIFADVFGVPVRSMGAGARVSVRRSAPPPARVYPDVETAAEHDQASQSFAPIRPTPTSTPDERGGLPDPERHRPGNRALHRSSTGSRPPDPRPRKGKPAMDVSREGIVEGLGGSSAPRTSSPKSSSSGSAASTFPSWRTSSALHPAAARRGGDGRSTQQVARRARLRRRPRHQRRSRTGGRRPKAVSRPLSRTRSSSTARR